ncbi:hypothetical protein BT63DRAFT_425068 [Microthyrium microscopicum]|uniref:Myb-like domain-containing protein n=1 Tax=Microthyrium microscopicum TaxID=703497 RepID=A0A6A6UCK8_9PEZI|nr:hypothetical protein BT63DRAFT_425068 [Microthyrium microscopicum]
MSAPTTCSPYQEEAYIPTSFAAVTCSPFNEQLFGPALTLPVSNFLQEMGTYDIDFHHFYTTSSVTSPMPGTSSLFPNIAHLTPVSEPSSDFHDSLTPISLHPPFDFPVLRPHPHLSHLETEVELPPSRPRSSPSTFGPGVSTSWPSANHHHEPQPKPTQGLGIQVTAPQLTPASSPRPRHQHSISSISETQTPIAPPPARRQWTPIAPNPAGLRQLQAAAGAKRPLSIDEDTDISPASKRKRSVTPSPTTGSELNMEDELLLRLKDDEKLTWKDIQDRFKSDMNKYFHIPALQMRLKRLRERMRTWTDVDVSALRLAHDYWVSQKFEIIANKMASFGAAEKWSAKQCERKWQDIAYGSEHIITQHITRTPTFSTSYTSSPVDGPAQGYYPFGNA